MSDAPVHSTYKDWLATKLRQVPEEELVANTLAGTGTCLICGQRTSLVSNLCESHVDEWVDYWFDKTGARRLSHDDDWFDKTGARR